MNKPTIFFSHSSSDKDVLLKLKDLFVDKTGGALDIFLSSDGQSIPLGRNWVHRVQEALDEASVMVVFLTPNSLRSSWIYFEAGYAYSKNIRVVPVGFLGADLSTVAPPLSLLQGFNITNKDGLDNLIALANDAYSHNHKSSFTDIEYSDLIVTGNTYATHPLGDFARLINEVHIELTEIDNLNCTAIEGMVAAKKILDDAGVEHRGNEKYIESFGFNISTTDGQTPRPIKLVIDPALLETTIPLVIKIIQAVRKDGIKNIAMRLDFANQVDCVSESHKLTARLYGTGVTFGNSRGLVYDGMEFTINHLLRFAGRGDVTKGATYLAIAPEENAFELTRVHSLLKILFDKKVLYESEQWLDI